MAESLVCNVVSQLTNLLMHEAASLGGVRDQIEWVKTELQLLQGFLKDADSRRKRGDGRMESWITGIRGVAYEMEDIIDTIKYMGERRHQRTGCKGSISRYTHKPCELLTLRKISSRIEQIKIKIQSISVSTVRYALANPDQSSAVDESLHSLRQFSPDVIVFENDKEEIVRQLLDGNVETRCVISIAGIGGLGKTTLARKVYNDPVIRKHFDTFGWVSVSWEYRFIKLLKDIMKEVNTGIAPQLLKRMDAEEVREMLSDFLRDKRYLVVLDNVWTEDVWRQMQRFFPDENNGSRILLTTRNIDVARDAETWMPAHKLEPLDDTESWKLFRRKAFPPNEDVPAELEALAQKLVKKCGGLPLALMLLGGLLLGKARNYDAWWSVARKMNWEDREDCEDGKESIISILGLCYNELPYPLKPCFLYIAAFPEDSIISASKLVRLWVAEGFIVQEQRQTMEDTARDWLDELVQRCMIQVDGRTFVRRRVKSIRIHDVLHDFVQSQARKEGFLHVCGSDLAMSDGMTSSHRAAFHNRMQDEVAISSPHLRTLLGFKLVLKDSVAAGRFLNGLNLLRVLDLEGAEDLHELPKEIGSMIHLRYLGLRRTGLQRLPSSIRRLLNLQTLDVRQTKILWLPKSFWKIRTLRHLYINIYMFISAPIIGDHKNLQTLRIKDFIPDMEVMQIVRSLAVRFIKTWVTTPGFTEEAIDKACERMFEESLGKALEKMDSLVSLNLILNKYIIPGDVLFARAPNLLSRPEPGARDATDAAPPQGGPRGDARH